MGKTEVFLPRIEPSAHEASSPSGLTVYYPFELVKFLGFFEDDETRAAGELLMSFLDSGGCRVTLRAKRSAVGTLLEGQGSAPDAG